MALRFIIIVEVNKLNTKIFCGIECFLWRDVADSRKILVLIDGSF